jgi:hypothetical protein
MTIKKMMKKSETKLVHKAEKKETACPDTQVVYMSRTVLIHPEGDRKALQEKLLQEIRKKAYELFEKSGRKHGNDLAHWFQAEKEILDEFSLRAG